MKYSESIKTISSAFLAIQKELKNPAQTKENPFFHSSYAPLNEILDIIRPICNKHNCIISQDIKNENENINISTILIHESGEFIQQEGLSLPNEKNTAQAGGISVTYGRRYSIQAFFGIASEEDNDGNIKNGITREKIEQEFPNSIEMLEIGKEVPKEFWNVPKEQRYKYIPEGCSMTKVEGKFIVLRNSK